MGRSVRLYQGGLIEFGCKDLRDSSVADERRWKPASPTLSSLTEAQAQRRRIVALCEAGISITKTAELPPCSSAPVKGVMALRRAKGTAAACGTVDR